MAEQRLIDANNLIEEIREERCYNCRNFKDMKCDYCDYCGTPDYIYMIENMPTVEAKPVVHAHWNDDGRCTNCGEHAPWVCECYDWYDSKYCHGCGAQMDEKEG